MSSRLIALLTFAAMLLAVSGAVSARDAGNGPPAPQSTPEVVFGKGDVSDFSALIHRNRNSHIIRITRGGVTQSFARGTGGRITSATSNVTGAPSYSYPSYDGQGRRTAANTNRGNWEYEYRGGENGDGQLHKATHTGHWDFVYNTDGIGRRVSVSSPASNGNLLANDDWDDPLNRFLSTQWTQQRILRASLDREADVEITETHALPTLLPGLPADPQLPLRDIVFPLTSPGTQGGWTAWSITGTLKGGGDPGAAPDRKAKLTGLTWFPPAEETFTYDAAGNRSGSARWSYTYDGLNRLTRAVNKDLATAPEAYDVLFTYDAEGRRHGKTSKRYSNGSVKGETHTTWIWDGWHPVVERVSDPKQNKPLVERKLVWGPDLSGQPGGAGGAGGLLLIRETNHSFDGRPPVTTDLLPLYDGSGNIVGLANPQGELLAEYWYGPFGELLEATGQKAETNPWRWETKSLDRETGLVYFGLRYYDPSTGQWLSREPLGEGESLNLYAYCHNDPINRVDVLGAAEWRVTGAKIENGRPMVEYTETEQSLWQFLWAGGSNVRKREWREATVYQRNQGWKFHYDDGWKLGPEPALQQQMVAVGEHMKGGPEFCQALFVGTWSTVAAAPLLPWLASGAPVVAAQNYGGYVASSLWSSTSVKVGVAAGGAIIGAEAIHNPEQSWDFIRQSTAEGLSAGPAFPIMIAGRAPGAFSNVARNSFTWPQWARPGSWRVAPGCNMPLLGLPQLEYIGAKNLGLTSAHVPVSGAQWYEYFAGKYGASNVEWARLPAHTGGKTSGVLATSVGEISLISGYSGPSASMMPGTVPGMNNILRAHVEAHAACAIRQLRLGTATLYLNKPPCSWGSANGCANMLPLMLGEGHSIRIVVPGQMDQIFTGVQK